MWGTATASEILGSLELPCRTGYGFLGLAVEGDATRLKRQDPQRGTF